MLWWDTPTYPHAVKSSAGAAEGKKAIEPRIAGKIAGEDAADLQVLASRAATGCNSFYKYHYLVY